MWYIQIEQSLKCVLDMQDFCINVKHFACSYCNSMIEFKVSKFVILGLIKKNRIKTKEKMNAIRSFAV